MDLRMGSEPMISLDAEPVPVKAKKKKGMKTRSNKKWTEPAPITTPV
jgi:hypothetical protein